MVCVTVSASTRFALKVNTFFPFFFLFLKKSAAAVDTTVVVIVVVGSDMVLLLNVGCNVYRIVYIYIYGYIHTVNDLCCDDLAFYYSITTVELEYER